MVYIASRQFATSVAEFVNISLANPLCHYPPQYSARGAVSRTSCIGSMNSCYCRQFLLNLESQSQY